MSITPEIEISIIAKAAGIGNRYHHGAGVDPSSTFSAGNLLYAMPATLDIQSRQIRTLKLDPDTIPSGGVVLSTLLSEVLLVGRG